MDNGQVISVSTGRAAEAEWAGRPGCTGSGTGPDTGPVTAPETGRTAS